MTQAIGDYGRIIRLDPHDAQGHYRRGLAYEQDGQLDKAIADYKTALLGKHKFAEAQQGAGARHGGAAAGIAAAEAAAREAEARHAQGGGRSARRASRAGRAPRRRNGRAGHRTAPIAAADRRTATPAACRQDCPEASAATDAAVPLPQPKPPATKHRVGAAATRIPASRYRAAGARQRARPPAKP